MKVMRSDLLDQCEDNMQIAACLVRAMVDRLEEALKVGDTVEQNIQVGRLKGHVELIGTNLDIALDDIQTM